MGPIGWVPRPHGIPIGELLETRLRQQDHNVLREGSGRGALRQAARAVKEWP